MPDNRTARPLDVCLPQLSDTPGGELPVGANAGVVDGIIGGAVETLAWFIIP